MFVDATTIVYNNCFKKSLVIKERFKLGQEEIYNLQFTTCIESFCQTVLLFLIATTKEIGGFQKIRLKIYNH